jgi:hypothetical protein
VRPWVHESGSGFRKAILNTGKKKKWVLAMKGWSLFWSIEVLQEDLKSNIRHIFIATPSISFH